MAHAAIAIDDDDGIAGLLKRCEQELGCFNRGAIVDAHRLTLGSSVSVGVRPTVADRLSGKVRVRKVFRKFFCLARLSQNETMLKKLLASAAPR
jgi:hypothetical protein